MASSDFEGLEEVLIEFVPMGKSVKVSAVDPRSGLEVPIVGPASASSTELKRNAMAKLVYMLKKKREAQRR